MVVGGSGLHVDGLRQQRGASAWSYLPESTCPAQRATKSIRSV